MQHILLSHLRRMADDDTAAVKEMKGKIAANLEGRYSEDGEAFMFLNTASYVDPRFHCLRHLDQRMQQEVHAKVLTEMTAVLTAEEAESANQQPAQDPPTGTALSAMGDLFSCYQQQQQPSAQTAQPHIADLREEQARYDREPVLPANADPLPGLDWELQKYRAILS